MRLPACFSVTRKGKTVWNALWSLVLAVLFYAVAATTFASEKTQALEHPGFYDEFAKFLVAETTAITDSSRLLPAPSGSNPWMPGTVPTSFPAPPGTMINMAMAPGQILPGGWATLDQIPDVNCVCNDLAVTPAFKPAVSEVQTFLVPEVLRSNLASSACKHTTASFTGGESTKSKY
jgi:hypothetical protein